MAKCHLKPSKQMPQDAPQKSSLGSAGKQSGQVLPFSRPAILELPRLWCRTTTFCTGRTRRYEAVCSRPWGSFSAATDPAAPLSRTDSTRPTAHRHSCLSLWWKDAHREHAEQQQGSKWSGKSGRFSCNLIPIPPYTDQLKRCMAALVLQLFLYFFL